MLDTLPIEIQEKIHERKRLLERFDAVLDELLESIGHDISWKLSRDIYTSGEISRIYFSQAMWRHKYKEVFYDVNSDHQLVCQSYRKALDCPQVPGVGSLCYCCETSLGGLNQEGEGDEISSTTRKTYEEWRYPPNIYKSLINQRYPKQPLFTSSRWWDKDSDSDTDSDSE